MAGLDDWNVAAASNNGASPDGWRGSDTINTIDNTGREMMAVLRRDKGDIRGNNAAGGTANALTITAVESAHSAYFDGWWLKFRAGNSNTGAATVNVSGIGAVDIVKVDPLTAATVSLQAGDITADGVYDIVYDSGLGDFVLLNPSQLNQPAIRLTATDNYTLASTTHGYQCGPSSAGNVAGDDTGFQGRDNGAAAAIELQRAGGNMSIGPSTGQSNILGPNFLNSDNNGTPSVLRFQSAGSAIRVGAAGAFDNVEVGNDHVDALNNGAASALDINPSGGAISLGGSTTVAAGQSFTAVADELFDGSTRVRDLGGVRSVTSADSVASGDRGAIVYCTGSGNMAFDIEDDATIGGDITEGSVVVVVNNRTAGGQVDLSGGAATKVGTTTLASGESCCLVKVATDTWAILGV